MLCATHSNVNNIKCDRNSIVSVECRTPINIPVVIEVQIQTPWEVNAVEQTSQTTKGKFIMLKQYHVEVTS